MCDVSCDGRSVDVDESCMSDVMLMGAYMPASCAVSDASCNIPSSRGVSDACDAMCDSPRAVSDAYDASCDMSRDVSDACDMSCDMSRAVSDACDGACDNVV